MPVTLLKKREEKLTFVLNTVIFILSVALFIIGHIIYSKTIVKIPPPENRLEKEIEGLKSTVALQKKQISEYKEIIDLINEENISLQNTIKMLALEGDKPENYIKPTSSISRGGVSRFRQMKYVGEWLGTAYTPSVEECGNEKGITSSGKPIIPGYSIAVDTRFWNYGQKFYIEGIGMVEAMDTGSAIRGRERFDLALFDRDAAFRFGKRKCKVWLIEETE